MSKRQIARMVTMLVIALVLVLAAWKNGYEVGEAMKPLVHYADVPFNPSDPSEQAMALLTGADGILGYAISGAYYLIMFLIAFVLLLPWCLISIRKKSVISPIEMKVAIVTYICVSVLSLVMGLIGAKFTCFLSILALAFAVVHLFGLLCVLPYWLAYRRCKKAEMNYES